MKKIYSSKLILLTFILIFINSFFATNSLGAESNNTQFKKSCNDLLVRRLKELIIDDKDNILEIQYEVTVLKLFGDMKSNNRKTIESLIAKKEIKLKKSKILNKLLREYSIYGENNDLSLIENKMKTALYWNREERFYDEDLSKYVLARSILEKKSIYSKADSAILWFHSSLEKKGKEIYGANSSKHNLLNTSTILYKLANSRNKKKDLNSKLKQLVHLKNSLFKKLFSELNSLCPRVPVRFGSCAIFQNEFEKIYLKSLISLKTNLDQGVFKVLLKKRINDKFANIASFQIHSAEKNDLDELQNISIQNIDNRLSFSDRKKMQEVINSMPEEDIIKAYQKLWGQDKTFAILNKKKLVIQVYSKSGEFLKEFPVSILQSDLRSNLSTKDQELYKEGGGSGVYAISSFKNETITLNDQRNRTSKLRLDISKPSIDCTVGFCYEVSKPKVEVARIYILPEDKNNHFLLKDGKIHFTSFKKRNNYFIYNYTPKDRKYKASYSQVKDSRYMNDTSIRFLKSLDKEKQKLMKLYGLDNYEYNMLIKYSFGILGVESKLGTSPRLIKEKIQFLVSFGKFLTRGKAGKNSRGFTQIKSVPKLIKKEYGITENDLMNPEKAAIATIGFLAQSLKELKSIEKNHPDITPLNRFDYLHYIYQGKRYEIINATATPEFNLYFMGKKEKEIGFGRNHRLRKKQLGVQGYMDLVDIYVQG